jgi:naphthoate synthase/2-ketocyclohexanecarboxyl-CoA hydrolase
MALPKYSDILYEQAGGIARITINRPEVLNALRRETYEELADGFRRGADDPSVGVFVLTGAGTRAFCAGGDVKSQAVRTPDSGRQHLRIVLELGAIMRNCGKPTIAAVNGYAIGGGHELHLMCDITVASEDAKLGQVGPRVGSVPVWGALQLLPRIVGEKRAREIVFLCQQYSAAEALAMGLVNRVVPASQLNAEVDRICQELLDKSPRSLRIAKMLMNHASDLDYNTYVTGAEMLAQTYGDEENLEGVHAFLQHRPPEYRKFRGAATAVPIDQEPV